MSTALTSIPTSVETTGNFDYAKECEGIKKTEITACDKAASNIIEEGHKLHSAGVRYLIAVGRNLSKAHGILSKHGSGTWGKWLKANTPLSRMVANRALRLFEGYGEKENAEVVAGNFNVDAALLACDEKTPEDVMEECLKRAADGERITKATVENLIKHDPELLPPEDLEPISEEEATALATADFVKRLKKFLIRNCKDWNENAIHGLDAAWREAYMAFIDEMREKREG